MLGAACESPSLDDRARELAAVIVRADEAVIRARPGLSAAKYERMRGSLYAYFRGTYAVHLHDARNGRGPWGASRFDVDVFPFSIGDAHLENFGTLRDGDGTFVLEPNDLDAADHSPWLWEVRRLASAIVVATRASNPEDDSASKAARAAEGEIVRAFLGAYAEALARYAEGAAIERVTDAGDSPVLADAFDRSMRDATSRRELVERTLVEGDERKLKRGGIDEDDPSNVYLDLAEVARKALPDALARYRATLFEPPSASFFGLKDAVRELGSGVASLPRVRIVALVEGPTDDVADDVLLELKELGDSMAPPVERPSVAADSVEGRILLARTRCWTRRDADPLWGTTSLLGLPMQVRGDFDAYKTLRVHRLVEERGTPDALLRMGADLGALLGRIHASHDATAPGTSAAIAGAIGADPSSFIDEQARFAVESADRTEADFARFGALLDTLGPTLGVEASPDTLPRADAAALIADPTYGARE